MTFFKDLKFEIKDILMLLTILGAIYKWDNKQTENFHRLELMIERLSSDYYNSKDNDFKLNRVIKPQGYNYRDFNLKNEAILPQAPKVPEKEENLIS